MSGVPTVGEVEAAIQVAHVVYSTIGAAGATGIPSGHLYAATMPVFANLGAYECCVAMLVKAGLVRREGLLLFVTAPR